MADRIATATSHYRAQPRLAGTTGTSAHWPSQQQQQLVLALTSTCAIDIRQSALQPTTVDPWSTIVDYGSTTGQPMGALGRLWSTMIDPGQPWTISVDYGRPVMTNGRPWSTSDQQVSTQWSTVFSPWSTIVGPSRNVKAMVDRSRPIINNGRPQSTSDLQCSTVVDQ